MAAAGLTITNEREQTFLFGPVYQQVNQQVVCRRGGANPKDVKALFATRFKVAQDTSYAEELLKQQTASQKISADEAPPSPATPAWLDENDDTEDLLEQVWQGKLDCTVADSNIIEINQRYYPELRVRFDLGDPESLAWALPIEADELQSRIEDWFDDFKAGDRLDALNEKYYGYIELFDYVDNKKFNRRIRSRLPKYKNLFKKVAGKYDLDWTLLAAQAYQESHWNPRARSPTGVRGMMMLTLTTARALNVKSRLDPRQSIEGGARYLSRLRKRIPQSVSEPDRTWFALAAYNVGMGHIHDARTLAKRLNRDPDSWRDLTEVLPLLSSKKHYRTLKYGYARGREPVSYVRHIRDYQNVLQTTLN